MKDEKALWSYISSQMGNIWDAQRHEDKISTGIPDVSFGLQGVNGWLELKHVKKYPKKSTTAVRIKHFTSDQKNWLKRRQKFGGNCWVLIAIETDIYLFRALNLQEIGISLSKDGLRRECFSHHVKGSPFFRNWFSTCLLNKKPES
jgi:hypothetical protein